jgi:hypothetical protein
MPASAGRVRMPHNNRMSASGALKTSDIWAKTIGHDPHASGADDEPTTSEQTAALATKATEVLAVARQQNLTGDSADRDNFAQKVYRGLKSRKKRRSEMTGGDAAVQEEQRQQELLLQEEDSSSEEEYEAVVASTAKKSSSRDKKSSKKKHRKKKRSKRSRRRDESSSSDDSSSSDSEEERRRRKRRKKRKRRKDDDHRRSSKRKRRHRSSSSSSEASSDERPFVAATAFTGSKKGYVFKKGNQGVGYYKDTGKAIFVSSSKR